MKSKLKIILLILLLTIFFVTLIIGCFHLVKHTNIKRYNETETIAEIEEKSKKYMLNVWLKSGIELRFITQELINEDILVYYFEVTKPDYFYAFGNRVHYIKTVYEFRDTGMLFYNSWQFDRVITSNYEEIKPLLEVKENE